MINGKEGRKNSHQCMDCIFNVHNFTTNVPNFTGKECPPLGASLDVYCDQSSLLEQYMSQSPLDLQIMVQLEMQSRNGILQVGDRLKVWYEDAEAW